MHQEANAGWVAAVTRQVKRGVAAGQNNIRYKIILKVSKMD